MRRRRFVGRRRSRLRAWLCLLCLLAGTAVGVKAADLRLRAQLHAMAQVRALAMQESALNDAVLAVLERGGYDELVHVLQNADGQITSVQTDALKLNLLKSRVSAAAEEALAERTQIVSIPAGSLTGLDLLAGCGPAIRVRVRMSGYAAADIHSEFTGAGVNQTLHRLLLRVHASVTLSMPHNTQQKQLTYEVCVAETVIVGTVPQLYAQMGNGE